MMGGGARVPFIKEGNGESRRGEPITDAVVLAVGNPQP